MIPFLLQIQFEIITLNLGDTCAWAWWDLVTGLPDLDLVTGLPDRSKKRLRRLDTDARTSVTARVGGHISTSHRTVSAIRAKKRRKRLWLIFWRGHRPSKSYLSPAAACQSQPFCPFLRYLTKSIRHPKCPSYYWTICVTWFHMLLLCPLRIL